MILGLIPMATGCSMTMRSPAMRWFVMARMGVMVGQAQMVATAEMVWMGAMGPMVPVDRRVVRERLG